MYNDKYFYYISDLMHHNLYASLLKNDILKEERCIISVFKKDNEVIVIERCNNEDIILKDTRIDKNSDITNYDLVFLKSLERYISNREMPGMIYEYMDGLGAWFRVKVDGLNPKDKCFKPFYLKKKINKDDFSKYSNNKDDLDKMNKLFELSKGLIKFSNPKKVEEFFKQIEK